MAVVLLFLVVGMTIVGVAACVPQNVWDAIEHRIRNPRPRTDALSELHRHWEESDRIRASRGVLKDDNEVNE